MCTNELKPEEASKQADDSQWTRPTLEYYRVFRYSSSIHVMAIATRVWDESIIASLIISTPLSLTPLFYLSSPPL
jgi:hypothetical protein